MYLKDMDNNLFTRLVQSKKVLGYFTRLLFSCTRTDINQLQAVYAPAKVRWPTLDVPIEVVVKEIESTILAYSDSEVGKDVVDIDVSKYRGVNDAILAEILPGVEEADYKAFLVDLLNGKLMK